MNEFRSALSDELSELEPPPLGDLVGTAVRKGRRTRRLRTAAAVAGPAVAVAAIATLLAVTLGGPGGPKSVGPAAHAGGADAAPTPAGGAAPVPTAGVGATPMGGVAPVPSADATRCQSHSHAETDEFGHAGDARLHHRLRPAGGPGHGRPEAGRRERPRGQCPW